MEKFNVKHRERKWDGKKKLLEVSSDRRIKRKKESDMNKYLKMRKRNLHGICNAREN